MNDGGPAFPNQYTMGTNDAGVTFPAYPQYGLTLRDYFAAQALSPLIAISDQDMRQRGLDSTLAYAKQSAVVAYAFADAMLAERAK